ncbi:DUF2919 family protein [Thiocapsa bogorovii]|uniref:DUF2919 family protein n=1 Tax=Thiocapsa bogorovii TaxID=521689 RepID=UPI001E28AA84|nr:DUF2919 family protein [Thiocapsa bogorovii]UHD17491.1 DUF2919 domain-containing protein [Thiocapsa bogorovii]
MSEAHPERRSRYASHRYDDDVLLKVPILLWLTLVFQVRHLLLLGMTFLPTTGEEIEVLRNLVRPELTVADLPAALVMAAGFRRRRPCPRWVRRIWRRAREILTLSILIYLGLLFATLAGSGLSLRDAIDEPLLASLLLSLAVPFYLWRSRLVADVARDCPESWDA